VQDVLPVLLGPCPSHAVARAVRGRVSSGGEVEVIVNATPGEHRWSCRVSVTAYWCLEMPALHRRRR
jgi:hypothetical protein